MIKSDDDGSTTELLISRLKFKGLSRAYKKAGIEIASERLRYMLQALV